MKIAHNIAAGIWICTGAFAADADQVAVVPPEGSVLLLEVVADGIQIYTCKAKGRRLRLVIQGAGGKPL